ncbi:MAG TPA: hypothetical protein VGK47_03730 [Nitrososphaeraceae archaeon]
MGQIAETVTFSDVEGVSLEIDTFGKGEVREDWEIIRVEIDRMGFRNFTPDEMISLGEWLIQHGERIKEEYSSSGHKLI